MLEATRKKIDEFHARAPQLGSDGEMHKLDGTTKVSVAQCEELADLHRRIKPDLSIEIGLAYGFSALYILDAMHEGQYGKHIAVDPDQDPTWRGIGVTAIKQLGFDDRFTWINERSDYALTQMKRDGLRSQFVFIDGGHLFETALMDVCCSDLILDVGGVIVIDDMWMPAIKNVCSYVDRNLKHFERLPLKDSNVAGYRKTGRDRRTWDHFADFGVPSSRVRRWVNRALGG